MNNKQLNHIIKSLTIKEKLELLSGDGHWKSKAIGDVISIYLTDGPHGIRKQVASTGSDLSNSYPSIAFPTASASACSFDKDLLYKMGVALAHDAKRLDVDMVLGPGINMKRSPLCGRNFEYFSEDPYLCGVLASSYVNGIQSEGISSCIKHFAANNQERNRFIANSIIDERTLHEIYFYAFEKCIKEASPDALMLSYNMLNDYYLSESPLIIKNYLRDELHYQGLIMTDWGAISNPTVAFKSGLNLEMPGVDKKRVKHLLKDYKKCLINDKEINEDITPLINLSIQHKLRLQKEKISDHLHDDLNIAEEVATNSIVLAKNKDNILPLKENQKILVIGRFASEARYQGSGSSRINPIENDSFLQVLDDNHIDYEYTPGYSFDDHFDNSNLIKQAVSLASFHDTILLFVGLPDDYEGEGFDKLSLSLPKMQLDLIKELLKLHKHIVLVVEAGSPIYMPFFNEMDGVFITYLAGCRMNRALYKLVFGHISPSGRLAESFPLSVNDLYIKDYSLSKKDILYNEGQYIGYRYYINNQDKKVLLPFGYGLSYSSFKYDHIVINRKKISFDLTNTGKNSAKEVIQIYVAIKDEVNTYKALKFFTKTLLLSGESRHFDIYLDDEMFKFYSTKKHDYVLGNGTYLVSLSTSSMSDIYTQEINIKDQEEDISVPSSKLELLSPHERTNNIKGHYDINSTFADIKSCFLGRIIYNKAMKSSHKLEKQDPESAKMVSVMLNEGPLRVLVMGTDGKMSTYQVQGLVDILNGHFFKGLHKLIHK